VQLLAWRQRSVHKEHVASRPRHAHREPRHLAEGEEESWVNAVYAENVLVRKPGADVLSAPLLAVGLGRLSAGVIVLLAFLLLLLTLGSCHTPAQGPCER